MPEDNQEKFLKQHSDSLNHRRQPGFTLIELLMVIAIIGILAAIATPMYSQYAIRGKFSEVKLAVYPIRSAISDCYQRNAGDASCNKVYSAGETFLSGQVTATMLARAATSSIVSDVTLGTGAIPVIQATVISGGEFNGETYTLTGTVAGTPGDNATVEDWTEGGTACTIGWC